MDGAMQIEAYSGQVSQRFLKPAFLRGGHLTTTIHLLMCDLCSDTCVCDYVIILNPKCNHLKLNIYKIVICVHKLVLLLCNYQCDQHKTTNVYKHICEDVQL